MNSPEEKIKTTVDGGVPGIISGKIDMEFELKGKELKNNTTESVSKEVIEKIRSKLKVQWN